MPRILRWAVAVESAVIATLGLTALMLAVYVVAARYLLPDFRSDWALDLIVVTVVWASFLSAGRLARGNEHIRVDLVVDRLPPRGRLALETLATGILVAVVGLMAWSGVPVVMEAIAWDERSSSTLRLPMWIYYLSLPVGLASVALQAVVGWWRLSRGGHRDTAHPPAQGVD